MLNQTFKLLIITLIISLSLEQNCQNSPNTDRIITGAHTFQLNPYTTRNQCFKTPLHVFFHNLQPQITSGISNIGQFQLDSSGIDFSLRSNIVSSNTHA